MTIETSYDSKYGSGDRRKFVKVVSTHPNYVNEKAFNGEQKDIGTVYNWQSIDNTFLFDDAIWIDEFRIYSGTSASNWFGDIDGKGGDFSIIKPNGDEVLLTETERKGSYVRTVSFPPIKAKGFKWSLRTHNTTSLREIEIKSKLVEYKFLIKKDNQYGYYTDSFQSLGTSYPTKEQFEQYGMSDLSMLEAGDVPVEYEMELVSETDEEKCFSYSFDLNGQDKNMKSIDGIITE